MRINLSFPVRNLIGTVANSDLVFFARGLYTFARSKVIPSNPNSPNLKQPALATGTGRFHSRKSTNNRITHPPG